MKPTIIHVNRHFIAANAKDGGNRPVFTVKQGRKNRYARGLMILGPCEFVYQPDEPLSCGARAWVETSSEVSLFDEMTYEEARKP